MIRLILAVLAIAVFTQVETFTSSCTSSAQTGCNPCLRPGSEPGKEVYNKPADVTALELDKSELHIPPKSGVQPEDGDSKRFVVSVKTTAVDPEGDPLAYNYTVSGGRIVGAGANVYWNLEGVMPGTYTITAGIDDGCGVCGKTVTKTMKIVQD